jgi:uncharacterized protein YjbJ (UPF0337 family)
MRCREFGVALSRVREIARINPVEVHGDGEMAYYLRAIRDRIFVKEACMDWNQIQGQWKQLKGKAKIKWGKLTDDEIDVVEGRRDELVGKIQQRYGIAKEQAEREVDDWMKEF